MDMRHVVECLLVVLCSGFLQGTVGFGFALLSVPLLLMMGLSMPAVMAICCVCTLVQTGSGVHHLRHAVPWRDVGVSVAVRVASMLLGILVLRALVDCPATRINFWVGLVMLLLLILQAAWQPQPRERLHAGWNLTAFLVSGFTGGLCSMDGPPLVLWVMAHNWTADRTRAFLFASFMGLVPFQLAVLCWTFGGEVVHGMAWGAACSPVVLLGSLLGLRVGTRFSKPLLRRLAFLLLTVIALSAMVPAVWRLVSPV